MTIEPIVFFDLVIATVVLAATLGIIVVSYVKTLENFKTLQKNKSDIESEAHKKATIILKDARNKAIEIMAEANLFEDAAKKAFDQALKEASLSQVATFQKASEELFKVYQKELAYLKENSIKIVNNISKDIENTTLVELEDFKQILGKETFASQKIVEGKIEEDYQLAEKELGEYKTERLKKIEDQIYNIIQNVSKEVLGKTLSLQEHEQLIIEALEKAKKEGTL